MIGEARIVVREYDSKGQRRDAFCHFHGQRRHCNGFHLCAPFASCLAGSLVCLFVQLFLAASSHPKSPETVSSCNPATQELTSSVKPSSLLLGYEDDEELREEEKIRPELLQGTEQSRISVPIFSSNYALSEWCLDELAFMADSRNWRKEYDLVTVHKWRSALADVGSLRGWELKNVPNGHQRDLTKLVAARVFRELKKVYLVVSNSLVGIEVRFVSVMRLLDIGVDDVRNVGIYDMGGAGKITLAKNLLTADISSTVEGIHELRHRLTGSMRWRIGSTNSKDLIKIKLSSSSASMHLGKSSPTDDLIALSKDIVETTGDLPLAVELKDLNLSFCNLLMTTPHFSMFLNLETPILEGCERLKTDCSCIEKLPHQLGALEALTKLIIDGTCVARMLNLGSLKNFGTLNAKTCRFLAEIPTSISQLNSLWHLALDFTGVHKVPDSIWSLVKLRQLSLGDCHSLAELPGSIGELKSLLELSLLETGVMSLPESIGELYNLEVLNIDAGNVSRILNTLGKLEKLRVLNASKRHHAYGQITAGLGLLPLLKILRCLATVGLFSNKLEKLEILSTNISTLPYEACALSRLKRSPDLSNLSNLTELCLRNYPELTEIQGLGNLVSLTSLLVASCSGITKLDSLQMLVLSAFLVISCCENLERLSDLSKLKKFSTMIIRGSGKLVQIQTLDSFCALKKMEVTGCKSIETLPDLSNVTQLQDVLIDDCEKLKELEGLKWYKDLKSLTGWRSYGSCSFPVLLKLKGIEQLQALLTVNISECNEIKKLLDLSRNSEELLFGTLCISLVQHKCGNPQDDASDYISLNEGLFPKSFPKVLCGSLQTRWRGAVSGLICGQPLKLLKLEKNYSFQNAAFSLTRYMQSPSLSMDC
ncbi:uncharacterized protein LOC116213572 [Punica granatum]|uniref:Uncharacterized protein LOC116213572 n=1 Tax=Punica granatum TaxID=22663 RepID=A0A6P8ED31_PUNGR|nr:uncharacterized protein LOC116213572 [Punica granatum]